MAWRRRCAIGFGLIVCALAPWLTGTALAQETVVEPVQFAIPDVWPWAFEGQDGQPHGSLIQIVDRLSQITGVPVAAELRPLRRALVELDAGDVNFTIVFQSPEMNTRAINVGQVLEINIVLAALADSTYPLQLDALAGARIGYIRGTYLGEAFKANTDVDKVPVAVISQAIEMLPLGRLSAILASEHAIMRTLQSMQIDPSELRYSVHIAGQSAAVYMSRKAQRPTVAAKFQDAIAQMEADGEFDDIFFGDAGRPQYDDSGRPMPAQ